MSPRPSSRRVSKFLSTPSARRATFRHQDSLRGRQISIHALREEGDFTRSQLGAGASGFLSTPSARRATLPIQFCQPVRRISIHALREEGDLCGSAVGIFPGRISIHALREEGDLPIPGVFRDFQHFYPRPPRGGRPSARRAKASCQDFYPRPPRGGRPFIDNDTVDAMIFLSTPSARRATAPGETRNRS
mgnify:CR=1 FL=1